MSLLVEYLRGGLGFMKILSLVILSSCLAFHLESFGVNKVVLCGGVMASVGKEINISKSFRKQQYDLSINYLREHQEKLTQVQNTEALRIINKMAHRVRNYKKEDQYLLTFIGEKAVHNFTDTLVKNSVIFSSFARSTLESRRFISFEDSVHFENGFQKVDIQSFRDRKETSKPIYYARPIRVDTLKAAFSKSYSKDNSLIFGSFEKDLVLQSSTPADIISNWLQTKFKDKELHEYLFKKAVLEIFLIPQVHDGVPVFTVGVFTNFNESKPKAPSKSKQKQEDKSLFIDAIPSGT